jgi:D-Tyr-tRNA(Tyr) deacylase
VERSHTSVCSVVPVDKHNNDNDDDQNCPNNKSEPLHSKNHSKQSMDTSSSQSSSVSNESNTKSVHLVFQRFRKCRLLLNEETVVHVGGGGGGVGNDGEFHDDTLLLNPLSSAPTTTVGLLVYVSFAATADEKKVLQAATTVLNLPIVTLGSWGDGSSTKSLLQWAALMDDPQQQQQQENKTVDTNGMAEEEPSAKNTMSPISLVLVPQANLISKVKSNGKSIQYHGLIAKARGEALYDYFCTSILDLALAHQLQCRSSISSIRPGQEGGTTPFHNKNNKPKKSGSEEGIDPSIAPHQMFREEPLCFKYSSWDDETGLPFTDAQGMPLTKSAMKRIQKLYEAQVKRHDKYLLQQQPQTNQDEELSPPSTTTISSSLVPPPQQHSVSEQGEETNKTSQSTTTTLDAKFLNVVCGTFGKRQGLSIMSDMGPFCHTVQI